jgi:hypothetical protein
MLLFVVSRRILFFHASNLIYAVLDCCLVQFPMLALMLSLLSQQPTLTSTIEMRIPMTGPESFTGVQVAEKLAAMVSHVVSQLCRLPCPLKPGSL